MTNISLRTYTREIEKLIDGSQADQAIAHCRHILKSYPKCVDAYRLLGKAYLESQRYGDAADIFQRVLSSVPDDFVSHVGMSLIREDEGNLDQAIWHMERAFEVQPANAAIQGELRRLYGRRDGMEPPKIRLTRGALARMYARGELFQQAVAEIRAALAEEHNRLDLVSLLASVYAQAGQKAEAVEMCNGLLRKLPYSLEGNRIMSEMLKDTDRVQDLQVYKRRLVALDPYFAQLSPAAPSIDRVPDQSVTIEHLQWSPGMRVEGPTSQPEWAASLGVQLSGMTSEKDILPDWLLNLEDSAGEKGTSSESEKPGQSASAFDTDSLMQFARETQKTEPSTDKNATASTKPLPPSSDEVIPEWMKEAGWQPSSGEAQEGESPISSEGEGDFLAAMDDESGLAQANIPEWLQAMAPSDTAEESPAEDSGDDLAWLNNLQAEGSTSQTEGEGDSEQAEDWLAEGKVEVPDWLKDIEEDKPAEEMPPTQPLTEKPATEESEPEELQQVSTTDEEQTAELPQATQPAEVEVEGEESVPHWLMEGMSGPDARSAGQNNTPQPQEEPAGEIGEEIPEWLKDFSPEDEAAAAGEEDEQVPDWLQSLAPENEGEEEEKGTLAEETVISGESEIGGTPEPAVSSSLESVPTPVEDEVFDEQASETQAALETQAAMETQAEAEPASEGEVSETKETPSEEGAQAWDIEGADDAFAWLEGLAVKQGAEEALLLNPEDRKEEPPDWVQSDLEKQAEASANESPATDMAEGTQEKPESGMAEGVSPEAQAEEELEPKAEAAEVPDWLQELGPQANEESSAGEIEGELPDWIKAQPEAQEPEPHAEQAQLEEEPQGEAEPAEIPDWLQALEAEGGEGEEPVPQAPEEQGELPEWLDQAPEMQEPEPTAEEAPIEEPQEGTKPAEIPDWLQALEPEDIEESEVEPQAQEVKGELPEWFGLTPEKQEAQPHAEEAPIEEPEQQIEPAEIPDWLQALEPQSSDEVQETPMESPVEPEVETWYSEEPPILGDTQPVKTQAGAQPPAVEPETEPEAEIPVEAETLTEEAPQVAAETGQAPEEIVPVQAEQETEPAQEQEQLPTASPEAEIAQEVTEESTQEPAPVADEWQTEEMEAAESEEIGAMLSDMQESDDAFAWLESLAVRQGADEALILNPEDRSETPPEWVQAEVEEEEVEEEEVQAEIEEQPAVSEQPAVLEQPDVEEQAAIEEAIEEQQAAVEPTPTEETAYPEELTELMEAEAEMEEIEPSEWSLESEAEAAEEEVMAWAEEEPSTVTSEQSSPEQSAASEQPAIEAEGEEEIPELPDWLQEGATENVEEATWTPPAVERPLERLDLNQASLAELERLPDIGFRMAQNIVNHRDTLGAFKSVDDLLDIPGLGPELLDDIREWLYVTPQAVEAPEVPTSPFGEFGEAPPEVLEARQHVTAGDLEQASQSYTQLIKNNQHLDAIIQDLQTATQRHPQAISLWQALGDAYLRAGQIQFALDAYNQAEELLG